MSGLTWMKEFYPISADEVSENKAIKHSLVKWYGLRKENLKKHGLERPPIPVNDDTCALCINNPNCETCPLFQFVADTCKGANHYGDYSLRGDPEPMIAALETIEFVERTCK